jgi:tripeptide aminopeptidase
VKESYLNMGPKLAENPRIVAIAMEATRAVGAEPRLDVIRGGTDGARLSYMGILTPNLFTGGQNYHSVREWASLQTMEKATQLIGKIAEGWVRQRPARLGVASASASAVVAYRGDHAHGQDAADDGQRDRCRMWCS